MKKEETWKKREEMRRNGKNLKEMGTSGKKLEETTRNGKKYPKSVPKVTQNTKHKSIPKVSKSIKKNIQKVFKHYPKSI